MSDLPVPEPTVKDEELALELFRIRGETNLSGTPEGDQRCGACHFYTDPDTPIAYCWHDDLEVMVGGSWSCDRWEEAGEPEEQASTEDRTTAVQLHLVLVEDQQWRDHPSAGQQCNACMYYLTPDDSISYCWHPEMQVGVGFDHWCRWWEEIPGEA